MTSASRGMNNGKFNQINRPKRAGNRPDCWFFIARGGRLFGEFDSGVGRFWPIDGHFGRYLDDS